MKRIKGAAAVVLAAGMMFSATAENNKTVWSAGAGSGSTVTTKEITEVYSPGKSLSDYGIFNEQA